MSNPTRPMSDLQMRVLRDGCEPEDDSEESRAKAKLWTFAFMQIDWLEAENQRLREHAERLAEEFGFMIRQCIGPMSSASIEAYRHDYPKEDSDE